MKHEDNQHGGQCVGASEIWLHIVVDFLVRGRKIVDLFMEIGPFQDSSYAQRIRAASNLQGQE